MKERLITSAMLLLAVSFLLSSCGGNDDENDGTSSNSTYEAVDLGLSVKWASCNLGAKSPDGYGEYYAWGETAPKSIYTLENYTQTKYNSKDGKYILDSSDDAATANMGKHWRLPSKQEMEELIDKCKWEWTEYNGVSGYWVTGLTGKSIFLPAAGHKDERGLLNEGKYGYYMSSSIYTDDDDATPYYTTTLDINFDQKSKWIDGHSRYEGFSVRPVYK